MVASPIFIVGIVFFFVYLIVRVSAHERHQRRRIELVERALDSGVIDDRTKRELVEAVAHRSWGGRGHDAGPHRAFLLGWIGLFAGVGMIIVSLECHGWWVPGVLTAAISFGVLSVPLAARELQARKHAGADSGA